MPFFKFFNLSSTGEKDRYISAVEEIGIDTGLRLLIATSEGDFAGRNFFELLKSYDTKITKRMEELQKKGLKPSKDKKYKEVI
ncbi:MAG: hypothetical protein QXL14_01630 [Candidatus Aenigmatarchaeota archaeon]